MTTSGIADAYLASGWCGRCGYKRSTEGECPNCDRWFTHPLLTVGGTLAASLILLLFVGIRSVRDTDTGFARFQNGLLHAAPMPAFVDPTPPRPSRNVAPSLFTSTAPGPIQTQKTPLSTADLQLTNLEALRETVHTAERGYRTGVSPAQNSEPASKMASAQMAEAQTSSAVF